MAADVVRLLAPGGHLFVYEAHPTVPLWSWDPDVPHIRPDRGYFAAEHVNDTYPARGAAGALPNVYSLLCLRPAQGPSTGSGND